MFDSNLTALWFVASEGHVKTVDVFVILGSRAVVMFVELCHCMLGIAVSASATKGEELNVTVELRVTVVGVVDAGHVEVEVVECRPVVVEIAVVDGDEKKGEIDGSFHMDRPMESVEEVPLEAELVRLLINRETNVIRDFSVLPL